MQLLHVHGSQFGNVLVSNLEVQGLFSKSSPLAVWAYYDVVKRLYECFAPACCLFRLLGEK